MGMDPPSPANRGWDPHPIPGQIGDGDGDGDRGFRALIISLAILNSKLRMWHLPQHHPSWPQGHLPPSPWPHDPALSSWVPPGLSPYWTEPPRILGSDVQLPPRNLKARDSDSECQWHVYSMRRDSGVSTSSGSHMVGWARATAANDHHGILLAAAAHARRAGGAGAERRRANSHRVRARVEAHGGQCCVQSGMEPFHGTRFWRATTT